MPEKDSQAESSEDRFPIRYVIKSPPNIGEEFINRKDIWKQFGGQWQQGIWRFPGESILNVISADESPYPDFIDPETGIIEYRGQGLSGNQKLSHGNRMLEETRLNKEAIRFWHQPSKGNIRFDKWVVVADRTIIFESDNDSNSAERILWFLIPVGSPNQHDWPLEVIKSSPLSKLPDERPIKRNPETLLERYAILNDILKQENNSQSTTVSVQRKYKRRKDARDMVLARSGQICEFDGCTGMPPDKDKHGKAILQVDHIQALSDGGSDIPENMIAVCPNCHAAKTHGQNRKILEKRFREIAKKKNEAAIKSSGMID